MTFYRSSPSGPQGASPWGGTARRRGIGGGLIIAVILAGFALCKYYSSSQLNEVTGKNQHISITAEQEIALGLESTPYMIEQFGGLHPDPDGQKLVKEIGQRVVQNSDAKNTPYQYDFHLLADQETVNAFALPGGQVFITAALITQFESEDQLAGVLGHEIGHVVARHGAERIAKEELTQGLTGAAVIASGDYSTAQAAQMIGNLVNMSYGRDQELESDDLGVRFMTQSGFNPEALISVMEILEKVSGGKSQPEFMSTHPSPVNRIEKIKEAIEKYKDLAPVQ
ncbi:MAG TPA: M48 family metallopeptidase [Saprospiraceae bacterium]|nr:M48 family metallopeptidase [Saprospiraceae bacterium]